MIKLFADNTTPGETQWKALELMLDSPVLPSASVCMWWLVVQPFFRSSLCSPPPLSHMQLRSRSCSLSLSRRQKEGKRGCGRAGVGTQSSLSAFFIWFPSSMHTEHIIPLYIFIFKVGVFALCSLSRSDFYTDWGNRTYAAYPCTKNVMRVLVSDCYEL